MTLCIESEKAKRLVGRPVITNADEICNLAVLSYMWNVGDVPDGMVVDHICENIVCINPDHLRLTTNGDNVAVSYLRRDRCKNGHVLSEVGRIFVKSRGTWYCRACKSDNNRRNRRAS